MKTDYIFAADTESTQPRDYKFNPDFKTRVWLSGYTIVGRPGVFRYQQGILETFDDMIENYNQKRYVVYFHNLAWDGSFVLNAIKGIDGVKYNPVINANGQWYKIDIIYKKHHFVLKDSLKILPFKLEDLANKMHLDVKKAVGTIDYRKDRPEGYTPDAVELNYFKCDLQVLALALEKVKIYGLLDNLTIGSACMRDYKQIVGKRFFDIFPEIPKEFDEFCRQAYKGAWCYVNPKIEDQILDNVDGHTYDVNSLYPYVMHSKSGNVYPVGLPYYYGETMEDLQQYADQPYIVRFTVSASLKPGKLPFLQQKNGIYKTPDYMKEVNELEFVMTKPEFELLFEQYDIISMDVKEFFVFNAERGLFDAYIDKWMKLKMKATNDNDPVLRLIAKLFLNNLYGKLATNPNASEMFTYEQDGEIKFAPVQVERQAFYIPAGCFITAYAKAYTLKAAQANVNAFCYSDTDSIHLINEASNIAIDPVQLGAWKEEARWSKARFVRKKTYIEKFNDGSINIVAAGCPEQCKQRFIDTHKDLFNDFTYGLSIEGKLQRKHTKYGYILIDNTFSIN